MKEYNTPRLQLIFLQDNDILTASPETEPDENDLWTPWV